MSGVGKNSQTSMLRTASNNEYERRRLLNIQANKRKLESLNVKRVAASMTSLVDSTFEKKKKVKKRMAIDADYEPDDNDHLEKESGKEKDLGDFTQKQVVTREGRKKNQFIPPMSLANLFKMNDKQRREIIRNDALRSAMKVVEEAMGSQEEITQHHIDVNQDRDNIILDDDWTNEEFDQLMSYREIENSNRGNNIDDEHDQMGKEIAEASQDGHGENDVYGKEAECHRNGDKEIVNVDSELVTLGKVRKTRGPVYCRKLTSLAPGETIFVEFNDDGIPIGDNASIFAFFLGEQVRNRSVCPVQVEGWEDFKSETLDHLWRCVLEKCDFDNPDLRREYVMSHARNLFRDHRCKLRRKYITMPNLTTKEAQLKNKPKDMLKSDWKYLVDLWRTPKFQEKSAKGKESRSFQKMPHYTGTKSHARVKEEIKKRN